MSEDEGNARTIVPGAFIQLIGYPGCGKLTIAKAIQRLHDAILVDNHSINNVIFSLIDTDGKTTLPELVWDNVMQVRRAVLATIRDLAKPGRSFIFTNDFRSGVASHHTRFEEVRELAATRGAEFLPVRLLIEPGELARRVLGAERVRLLKETDASAALARPKDGVYSPPISHLAFDVTAMSADEVATSIVRAVRECEPR